MKIFCASTNAGKLREFGLIVAHYSEGRISVEPAPGLRETTAPEETGLTFAANAAIKAEYYSRGVDGLLFADDSGLCVDALGGAPGIYSARYAGEAATDAANNDRVLAALSGHADRAARFVCAIAIAREGSVLEFFEDHVEGSIVDAPRGANGFGYDPLFYHPPFGSTFGEAAAEQKLLVSHRGKAIAKMVEWLESAR